VVDFCSLKGDKGGEAWRIPGFLTCVPGSGAEVDQIRILDFWKGLTLAPWKRDLRVEVTSSDDVEATTGESETPGRDVDRMTEVRTH